MLKNRIPTYRTFQVLILKHREHTRCVARSGRPGDVGGIAGKGVEARPAVMREDVVLVREGREGVQFCSPRNGSTRDDHNSSVVPAW